MFRVSLTTIHVCVFIIAIVLVSHVESTIFTPCSFARVLYKLLEEEGKSYALKEIPLLVCIAGYQKYDTNYIMANIASSDGFIDSTYNGIFGLLLADMRLRFPETHHQYEQQISQDLNDFLEKILHVSELVTHPNYEFYRSVCSKPHVRELSCRLNDYVLMNYKVYEPLNYGLLDEYRRMPHPTDDQPFLLTADLDSKSITTSTTITHTTHPFEPFLYLVIFWIMGSTFYVVARYTYDYLHFKYLRNIIALG